MKCKICSSSMDPFARGKILQKYRVAYFLCSKCGFVQTEEPYWLEEAYTKAINTSDVGLVNRNIMFSQITKVIISLFFDRKGKFLDYGGGYGLFVRLMRDLGYDFYWYDKFCANLFAKGLEHLENDKYDLVTAFEIVEHLKNPVDDVAQMLKYSRNILLSTELLPNDKPKPSEWWYYGLEHGQHISFYTFESLSALAQKFGLNLYSNEKTLHLLTEKTIPPYIFKLVSRFRLANILSKFLKKNISLTQQDYVENTVY